MQTPTTPLASFWPRLGPRFDRLRGVRRHALTLGVLLWAVVGCPQTIATPHVDAKRVTPFVRGVGLGLFATQADYDYRVLLDEIVTHGATDVLIVVAWYQSTVIADDIQPRVSFSPTDENVVRTIRQAKKRGLRVSLLPIVRLERRTTTEWRGRIKPARGVDVWFDAYRRYLMRMARAAREGGADRFGVGSELLTLERHESHWRALIQETRSVFPGRLFYSANWDHFDPIRFWDALDDVGVTAYFELTRDLNRPTDAALSNAWVGPRRDLRRLRRRLNKPVFLTEIGYPSKTTAARFPWDETRAAPVDLEIQAQLIGAFCDSFDDAKVIDGFFVWNWFGFGGPKDGTYTPRGKPAAKVMKECLERKAWEARPLRGARIKTAPNRALSDEPSDIERGRISP